MLVWHIFWQGRSPRGLHFSPIPKVKRVVSLFYRWCGQRILEQVGESFTGDHAGFPRELGQLEKFLGNQWRGTTGWALPKSIQQGWIAFLSWGKLLIHSIFIGCIVPSWVVCKRGHILFRQLRTTKMESTFSPPSFMATNSFFSSINFDKMRGLRTQERTQELTSQRLDKTSLDVNTIV